MHSLNQLLFQIVVFINLLELRKSIELFWALSGDSCGCFADLYGEHCRLLRTHCCRHNQTLNLIFGNSTVFPDDQLFCASASLVINWRLGLWSNGYCDKIVIKLTISKCPCLVDMSTYWVARRLKELIYCSTIEFDELCGICTWNYRQTRKMANCNW